MARIVVIGGGASGVLAAVHLLRRPVPSLEVILVEQRAELGAGIAYSTRDPDHLLNVRASNMSAFGDDPSHFHRWLKQSKTWTIAGEPDATSFAPRHLYRHYLESLLAPHFDQGRLALIRSRAQAISDGPRGTSVVLDNGTQVTGDKIVVATGNEGPKLPPAPWRYDGWTSSPVPDLPKYSPVVIIGTGLTMVDWVLTLLHGGHRGAIFAISPRGLEPHPHHPTTPTPLLASELPLGLTMSQATRWLRGWVARLEAEGVNWRSAIDALRPHTQDLWQALRPAEKQRFLRHARAWWDRHRHRIAPAAAERLEQARREGQLQFVAGRVRGFREQEDGVDVAVGLRGTSEQRSYFARAVFECRGRASNLGDTDNPLLRSLLDSGQARPDALQLGLDVTPACALIDRSGNPSHRLYAIGPVTSGVFWEVTAVPDIRVQTDKLARELLGHHLEV